MFVGRREDRSIYGTWTVRPDPKQKNPNVEELADDHPDVVAFLNRPLPQRTTAQKLAAVGLTAEELKKHLGI